MIERINSIAEIDRGQLEQLASEFFAEAKVPGKFNYEHFCQATGTTMQLGISAMWISKRDGILVGALCGLLYPNVFTGDVSAIENFWFVTKKCRGVDGLSLMAEFERWAIVNGASQISVAYMEAIHPETMAAFYERRGFTKLETVLIKEIV